MTLDLQVPSLVFLNSSLFQSKDCERAIPIMRKLSLHLSFINSGEEHHRFLYKRLVLLKCKSRDLWEKPWAALRKEGREVGAIQVSKSP